MVALVTHMYMYFVYSFVPLFCVQFCSMSHIQENQLFCICKIKDADQLCSNCTADQCLCFCCMDSTNIQDFKLSFFFHDCTGWLMSDLINNPKDWFLWHSGLYFACLVPVVLQNPCHPVLGLTCMILIYPNLSPLNSGLAHWYRLIIII